MAKKTIKRLEDVQEKIEGGEDLTLQETLQTGLDIASVKSNVAPVAPVAPPVEAKGKYLNAEKNAKRVALENAIATALEAGDIEAVKKLNAERTALFAGSGRGAITEVKTEPEEFLSAESNGELRIVVKIGEKTFCGKTAVSRWAGKDRAYLYFDLKKHGLI